MTTPTTPTSTATPSKLTNLPKGVANSGTEANHHLPSTFNSRLPTQRSTKPPPPQPSVPHPSFPIHTINAPFQQLHQQLHHLPLQFTSREAELQRLLQAERQRSEQRRENYALLKEEHLKLQAAYLSAQAETKTILEETLYFKEKKSGELEELLARLEEKSRAVERLERALREAEPEHQRLRLAAELEEPMRRLEKEAERLAKERDRAGHEAALARQALEHAEREHLDALERGRLAAEAELRLRVPEVKRLLEAGEEISRLKGRLEAGQQALEQAEAQYRAIQGRVEAYVIEEEARARLHEGQLRAAAEALQAAKDETKAVRGKLALKAAEVEDLSEEVARLKRLQDRLRHETEQLKVRFEAEKEEVKRAAEEEKGRLVEEVNRWREAGKALRQELAASSELNQSLQQALAAKEKEAKEMVASARKQEAEKVQAAEEKRESLEAALKVATQEKALLKAEAEKARRQVESAAATRLTADRELVMLRAKLDAQAEAVEEYEKMRRQHAALHEELNRLRADNYDLAASGKEAARLLATAREEAARARELAEKERANGEEARLNAERLISKAKGSL
ncbi:hypothetical protein TYRP_006810 [Tyrophagus putrescentiae]|nr:hypothetical protein TYRP_006810 [Tyrophagus putrescentiae]